MFVLKNIVAIVLGTLISIAVGIFVFWFFGWYVFHDVWLDDLGILFLFETARISLASYLVFLFIFFAIVTVIKRRAFSQKDLLLVHIAAIVFAGIVAIFDVVSTFSELAPDPDAVKEYQDYLIPE